MKVTSITQQVKDPTRYNISIDGKFAFGVDELVLLEQKLKVGSELDDKEVSRLKEISEIGRWYKKCLEKIARRPHSEKEIADYLWRKDQKDKQQIVIEKLRSRNYLNDLEFAKWFTEQRRRYKSKSARAISAELRVKGVSRELIEDVLKEESVSDEEALKDLIEKKIRLSKYKNDKLRLMQYLVRQGYSYSSVKEALAISEDAE